jgi:hypothetical protein
MWHFIVGGALVVFLLGCKARAFNESTTQSEKKQNSDILNKIPASLSPIFQSPHPLFLQITVPFSKVTVIENKSNSISTPIVSVDGILLYPDASSNIEIPLKLTPLPLPAIHRCKFPDFLLHFRTDLMNSVFANGENLTLFSPCQAETNKISDEVFVHRLALAYEILESQNIPIRKFRKVQTRFLDSETKKTYERHALIFEDPSHVAERFNGQLSESASSLANEFRYSVSAQQILRVFFGQLLIGNKDWDLGATAESKGNLRGFSIVHLPQGLDLFLPERIEKALIVTDINPPETSLLKDFYPNRSENFKEIVNQLIMLRKKFPHHALIEEAKHFLALRKKVEEKIGSSPLNEESRKSFRKQTDAFYEALQTELPSFQSNTHEKLQIFSDNDLKSSVMCAALPKHSIFRLQNRSGRWSKIQILEGECQGTEGWVPLDL